MANKILKDFGDQRFDTVIRDVRNYLRKISKIKKNDKDLDSFEVFLLKFLNLCTKSLDNTSSINDVAELSEIGISVLSSVRFEGGALPPLALEKILIHLAKKLFDKNFSGRSCLALQHLYNRMEALSSQPPAGFEPLLDAVHKTTLSFAARLERELSLEGLHPFLTFYCFAVRFQMLMKDGLQLACKRVVSSAYSLQHRVPECLAEFMTNVVQLLEEESWSKLDDGSSLSAVLYLLFHFATLTKGKQTLHQKYLLRADNLLTSVNCKSDFKNLKSVWGSCFLLLDVTRILQQSKQPTKESLSLIRNLSDILGSLDTTSIAFEEPSIGYLLDQLNNFRKVVEVIVAARDIANSDLVQFLFLSLEILTVNSALLEGYRKVNSLPENGEERTDKVSMSLLKNLYACIDCHLILVKCGEGTVEVMRSTPTASTPVTAEDVVESLPCFNQIRDLLDSDKKEIFEQEERQWLANMAYNFALVYHQQKCPSEAGVMLEFACMALTRWCGRLQDEACVMQQLEESNFFKKLSLLCSCKRKANQSEDVHKILGFILDCLSRPTVIPSKLLSLIVVEWSKTNASLHPDLQRTLCSVLSASPLLGLPQVLRWSRSELIQYQSLGRLDLQLEVLSSMTAAVEGDGDEGNKWLLAGVLLERAQLSRMLEPTGREHESIEPAFHSYTPLQLCNEAIELLEGVQDANPYHYTLGKAYFWKAVFLHEMGLGPPPTTPGTSMESSHSGKNALPGCSDVDDVELFGEEGNCPVLTAAETALHHWMEGDSDGQSDEEDLNERLNVICSSLAFVMLHRNVGLQLKAIAILLRYCPPGCTQYYMAIASFHQLVVQHRWGFLEMTEMTSRMSRDSCKPVSRDLQCAGIHARMRTSVTLAERGEGEEALSALRDVLHHEVFSETSSHSYHLLANVKQVSSSVLRHHKLSGEVKPDSYLQHILHGSPDHIGQLVTHYVPSLCQLEVDAVHILLQLAERLVPKPHQATLSAHSPSHTTTSLLTNPWTVLHDLLVSLDALVTTLVGQDQLDVGQYYVKHGLSISGSYGLRLWYSNFLLRLSEIKSLMRETSESRSHLSLVLRVLHLNTQPSRPEELPVAGLASCKCVCCEDIGAWDLVCGYFLCVEATGQLTGLLHSFDAILGNFQVTLTPSDGVVQTVKDILERRLAVFTRRDLSSDMCRNIRAKLDLCRCRVHLARGEWSLLLAGIERLLSEHSLFRSRTLAELHLMKGKAVHHLSAGDKEEGTVVRKTGSSKGRGRKKKSASTATTENKTVSMMTPLVESLLRAHHLCMVDLPVAVMRDVCSWLASSLVGVSDNMAALFACQSCNVSLYHRLVEKQSNAEHQNTHLAVLNVLDIALGSLPQHLALKEEEVCHFFQFSSLSTVPALMKVLSIFPKEWVFFHILTTVPHSDKLVLSRMHQSGDSVTVCVGRWGSTAEEFDALMASSLDSMKMKQNKMWKEERIRLNGKLKDLLEHIDRSCLGPWQCMHGVADTGSDVIITREVEDLSRKIDVPSHLLVSLLHSLDHLEDEDLDAVGRHFSQHKSGKRSKTSLSTSLKSLDIEEEGESVTVVITDEKTQLIPWESVPSLAESTVTRMPSVLFAVNHYVKWKPHPCEQNGVASNGINVSPANTFYVLNPRGDLSRTEQMFAAWLRQKAWEGLTGKAPTKDDLMTAVSDHDLFIYIGHGGGQEYLSGRERAKLDCRAAAILMGCSSAKLTPHGTDGRGIILDYLLAGSPAVLGNLWDVTDKDIDRYTKALLENLPIDGPSLQKHVTVTRSTCDLPYLTGSSPIIYGLPIYFQL